MFLNKRKKYKKMTDEELVNLYKSEESSLCIGILYERYAHLVLGVSMKYLKNEMEAEDLTMKVFEELPLKLKKHSIDYFKSWLYVVTKNECFSILRKNGKETSIEYIESYDQVENNDLENKILDENKILLLEKAIHQLKSDQKKCITLFYINEKSYQQICDELGLSLMKVKSSIQNGKRNIKLLLEEQNEFKKN
jgi:RNA polymerase sigma-70 factor (ECF subfamily)